jgi:hypothetical protein
MIQIEFFRPVNAIRRPSGDHAGYQPDPSDVSLFIPVPFGRIVKMSLEAAEDQRPNTMRPFNTCWARA